MNSRIPVFLSFAHNFWPHTAVTACSALDHAADLDLHIFSDRFDRRWFAKINAKARSANSEVYFHEFDSRRVQGLKNCGHYGLSTYYRLFIPDLLSAYDQCLVYLDSDLIVRGSLHHLLASCEPVSLLAAVPGISKRANQAHAERLAHGLDCAYFNAGVMVINGSQWRKLKVRDQCLAFQEDHPERIRYADQDMLNYCLAGQWQPLPISWNVMVDLFSAIDDADLVGVSPAEHRNACAEPMIVHYNGQFKPWHFTYRHPFKSSCLRVRRGLQKTPYVSDDFPWALSQKLARRMIANIFVSRSPDRI